MAKYIGTDFTPPDVIGKVTGKAKFAEDIHVDGMVFARLLTSPVPHARIKSIDLSSALAMDGVVGAHAAPERQHTRLEVQLSGITTASLTSALVELGTLVFSVEPHEPTLEDVFLASTEEEE